MKWDSLWEAVNPLLINTSRKQSDRERLKSVPVGSLPLWLSL